MLTYSKPPMAGMGFVFKWNGREVPRDKVQEFFVKYMEAVKKKAKSDQQVISGLHYEIAQLEQRLDEYREIAEAVKPYNDYILARIKKAEK